MNSRHERSIGPPMGLKLGRCTGTVYVLSAFAAKEVSDSGLALISMTQLVDVKGESVRSLSLGGSKSVRNRLGSLPSFLLHKRFILDGIDVTLTR